MNRRKFLALLSGLVALPKIVSGLAKPDLRGEVGQMVGIPFSDVEIVIIEGINERYPKQLPTVAMLKNSEQT